jgi:hypothetical protein
MEFDLAPSDRQHMPIQASKPAASTVEDQAILSWTVHLACTQPAKSIVSVAFICAATTAGCFVAGPFAAGLVAAALVASLADFLFPVRYVITRDKASCKMLAKGTEIRWADVKRCYLDNCGVKLSPLDRVSRLEAFRGVYLRFAGNKDEVIEIVKSLRPSDV